MEAMRISQKKIAAFRARVRINSRALWRDFPWRRTKSPYRILVSEIMLQQTQTKRVLPKYRLFVKQFPNFEALSIAPLKDVLFAWQGLGYNRRALALKKASAIVRAQHRGRLPKDPEELLALPGIGRATAGAVAAFAFNRPAVFVETNIRRVFIHYFFARRTKVSEDEIMHLVIKTLDRKNPRQWYWALMDWGAKLAELSKNPNQKSVSYRKQAPFLGSHRQLRGKMLRLFVAQKKVNPVFLRRRIQEPAPRIKKALDELLKEGFVRRARSDFVIG